jgi:hypothetical protein
MSEEKKIIIDEDWKSQVAAEKEVAKASPAASGTGASERPSPSDYPEASFDLLVSTFVTEAMVALGQFPHPGTGAMAADLAHAKFAIDMVAIIAEKTKGNLSAAEENGLEGILHQLRMGYLAATTGAKTQAAE